MTEMHTAGIWDPILDNYHVLTKKSQLKDAKVITGGYSQQLDY